MAIGLAGELVPPGRPADIGSGARSGLRGGLAGSLVDVDELDGDVSDGVEPEAAVVLDGEPGEELVPESVGSANATPGLLATAIPTPSATANAPTRPM